MNALDELIEEFDVFEYSEDGIAQSYLSIGYQTGRLAKPATTWLEKFSAKKSREEEFADEWRTEHPKETP